MNEWVRRASRASAGAVLAVALGSSGCSEAEHGPDGPGLEVALAPLTLAGVEDVCIDLTIDGAAGRVVTLESICSSDYGASGGAGLTYIAPCDASPEADLDPIAPGVQNRVTLRFDHVDTTNGTLLGSGASAVPDAQWTDPCPDGCGQTVVCSANQDTLVSFDITVMRRAQQGFFDVAVELEDVFCSAKADCETASGAPNLLLFDPQSGERVPTVVLALACTGGLGADTHLWLERPTLTCGSTTLELPVDRDVEGNVYTTNPDGPLAQVALYRGVEQLTGAGGASYGKLFVNTAFALDPLPSGTTCALHGRVSASDGEWDDLTTPAGVYPVIAIDLPLLADSEGLQCGRAPLDDPDAAPGTGVHTTYVSTPTAFDVGFTRASDEVAVLHPAPATTVSTYDVDFTGNSAPSPWVPNSINGGTIRNGRLEAQAVDQIASLTLTIPASQQPVQRMEITFRGKINQSFWGSFNYLNVGGPTDGYAFFNASEQYDHGSSNYAQIRFSSEGEQHPAKVDYAQIYPVIDYHVVIEGTDVRYTLTDVSNGNVIASLHRTAPVSTLAMNTIAFAVFHYSEGGQTWIDDIHVALTH